MYATMTKLTSVPLLATLAALTLSTTATASPISLETRQQAELTCTKPSDFTPLPLSFTLDTSSYYVNLVNQSIVAQPESTSKWEFRACSLPDSSTTATLGYPTATSGHVVLTPAVESSSNPPICLHANYELEILDFQPCNYLDNSGQQEFYWLYDQEARTVTLAGQPASADQHKRIWRLDLGAGRPPAIAVKPTSRDQHPARDIGSFVFSNV